MAVINVPKKYIDRQLWNECQVVAAINAAIKLGLPTPDQGSSQYEELVELAFAKNGAAINISAVLGKLRLRVVRRPLTLESVLESLKRGRPVAISVWHKNYGFHMLSIVDIYRRGGAWVRIPNFRLAAPEGWMPWSAIKRICHPCKRFGSVGGGAKRFWAWEFRRI